MLDFICDPCKKAADMQGVSPMTRMVKRRQHDQCKGSKWCDCQHRIGAKTA